MDSIGYSIVTQINNEVLQGKIRWKFVKLARVTAAYGTITLFTIWSQLLTWVVKENAHSIIFSLMLIVYNCYFENCGHVMNICCCSTDRIKQVRSNFN